MALNSSDVALSETATIKLTANLLRQRSLHKRWHRYQANCHILRSQLGFDNAQSERPTVCIGCDNYHGKTYGQTKETRNRLICGFHPNGWQGEGNCPDFSDQ
jgi:hypothetical protein